MMKLYVETVNINSKITRDGLTWSVLVF